ncbi:hypothetical protein MVEN_00030100 [Mycena venus]|uniref:Uncharacterized protein n=1 Tax=Mycena venus TaxID=2733690 RepID=A0A8H6Z8I2_9AGAR|nr:hypothetical protein MVEN_00030100 [Mycena venus]
MSSLATFCDVAISTGFDGCAASSSVSLDCVINSGLRTCSSQLSGRLTLPCDAGVISMCLNNVPVTASLASDLVLGLDWLHLVQNSAPNLVVHLSCGGSLDLRTFGSAFALSSSTASPLAPVLRGNIGAEPSPSSVSTGGPGAVPTPSSMPSTRGIDVVAACALAARTPHLPYSLDSESRPLSIVDLACKAPIYLVLGLCCSRPELVVIAVGDIPIVPIPRSTRAVSTSTATPTHASPFPRHDNLSCAACRLAIHACAVKLGASAPHCSRASQPARARDTASWSTPSSVRVASEDTSVERCVRQVDGPPTNGVNADSDLKKARVGESGHALRRRLEHYRRRCKSHSWTGSGRDLENVFGLCSYENPIQCFIQDCL